MDKLATSYSLMDKPATSYRDWTKPLFKVIKKTCDSTKQVSCKAKKKVCLPARSSKKKYDAITISN